MCCCEGVYAVPALKMMVRDIPEDCLPSNRLSSHCSTVSSVRLPVTTTVSFPLGTGITTLP